MDEIVYNALSSYFGVLEKTGYLPDKEAYKLLVLSFFKDFLFKDYRGILSAEDYRQIELALDCLYGSTCLIPYPDYLKGGQMHIGSITELATRVRNNEDYINSIKNVNVLKAVNGDNTDSDVIIVEEE